MDRLFYPYLIGHKCATKERLRYFCKYVLQKKQY